MHSVESSAGELGALLAANDFQFTLMAKGIREAINAEHLFNTIVTFFILAPN